MNNSSNPIFRKLEEVRSYDRSESATYTGVSVKTGILLLVAFIAAYFANNLIKTEQISALVTILSVSGIVTFISVLIGTYSVRLSMPFSVLYSAGQGFTLGALTVLLEMIYPESQIGLIAVLSTGVIFGVVLLLYSFRILRATPFVLKLVMSVLIGLFVFSLISLFIPALRESFGNSLLISGLLIVFGAVMLILNFNNAEEIVSSGAPKAYEWTVSLGLMVTIFWIYLQVLRFLVILLARNRD